ncbi:MAG: hypothetical protein M1829_005803 [Trizodia sp. TS-e1964]|nr:MAG: hypothetical protein M1829_005803 [Trizodia sp. TS-e1964]
MACATCQQGTADVRLTITRALPLAIQQRPVAGSLPSARSAIELSIKVELGLSARLHYIVHDIHVIELQLSGQQDAHDWCWSALVWSTRKSGARDPIHTSEMASWGQ